MYYLKNDYSEGAHPKILEALIRSNDLQCEGYGCDPFTIKAEELIKTKMNNNDANIYFLSGGTQTNLIAIASFLRPYEACISANTGHIFVNETGAIENTGHKVISVECEAGKLTRESILNVLKEYDSVHVVEPKLVYISNSTELGTIYTKAELESLNKVCRQNDLILYMDGARLGSALACSDNDLTLEDISKLTDAFYIGATKNGALLGEAIVINNKTLNKGFDRNMKQKGGLLAKGRLLGIQFAELFTDDLFFDIAKKMNETADMLKRGIADIGYDFLSYSPTNQLFPILPNNIISELEKDFGFYIWTKVDEDNSSIRLITSWSTTEEAVNNFLDKLKVLSK